MISRLSSQRFTRPEQPVVKADDNSCAGAPQDGTMEVEIGPPAVCDLPLLKSEELSIITLPSVAEKSDESYGPVRNSRVAGGNRHFRYRPYPPSPDPIYSDHAEVEESDSSSDEAFARGCIAALSNLIGRRIARAMIDLVGIEPHPGPKTRGKKKSKKTSQSTAVVTMGRRPQSELKSKNLRAPDQAKSRQKGQSMTKYGMTGVSKDSATYFRVLSNPWDNVPVRLGGESMQPSGIATCVTRFVGHTDSTNGCYSLVYYPWANNPLMESNSVDAPYSYNGTAFEFPQGPSLGSLATGGRIIAAGIRVTSLQSSTNDQGLITIGCLPRDSASPTLATCSIGGFPFYTTSVATQGFVEFANYLSTESFPFRCGASAVWRPEDPLDFEFRTQIVSNTADADIIAFTPLTPFIVVGISGTANSASFLVELISHIEYTINEGTTGVVNTGMGTMNSVESFGTAKRLFAGLVNTAFQGITGGLSSAGPRLLQTGAELAGSYFESSVRG